MLTAGSLFAGYGGIELALSSVLDVRPAWFVEFDKAPSKVLTHHWPDVPNHGDVTKIDWATVEPVDIITGGSPCQDLSHAGKRAGMTEGTRSNLWVQMREAINVIRPRLVAWENVRGAFSAPADSALEPCPGCVGDGDDGPVLRALGRVLGDLADLGYDCRWYGIRAADVGAAHGRFRVFLFATPAADAEHSGRDGRASFPLREAVERATTTGRCKDAERASLTLLPTPQTSDTNGPGEHGTGGPDLRTAVSLLPTPTTQPTTGNGHARNLGKEARLLPTPLVGSTSPASHGQISGQWRDQMAHALNNWGQYAAAIARAEQAIGRPAPQPTEIGPKGAARLSPRFVEFLMMLPEGWVTDVAGLTRNELLKMLGNGVVPAQCAAALRAFLWDAYGIGAAA
jgi:DNA (cytosine-5)-methyltransferase 1